MTFAIAENGGHTTWSQAVDNEGNREYRIIFRVETDDPLDGPGLARLTPGLPVIGSSWQFDNESDPWAFCLPGGSTVPVTEPGEPCTVFDVEFIFSSKPPPQNQQRCNDQKIEDPLLEPPRLSGGSTKYSEEAAQDRFGQFVCSSSFEPIRGQVNEWDANRSSIRIEMNVASFAQVQLALAMRDCVNILPLWGFARRCIKLSNVTWERKYYGFCYQYYSLSMEFDTNQATFDRYVLDEGHKCLDGYWEASTGNYVLKYIGTGVNKRGPNPNSPSDFIRIPDREGNPTKMVLSGTGLPACATVAYQSDMYATLPPGLIPDDRYVCIREIASGIGVSPAIDIGTWLRIANMDEWEGGFPPNFEFGFWYLAGAVVQVGTAQYVSLVDNAVAAPESGSSEWQFIPPVVDAGIWSVSTAYAPGQVVQVQDDTGTSSTRYITTGIGRRHLQVYSEANFLALGIPAYL